MLREAEIRQYVKKYPQQVRQKVARNIKVVSETVSPVIPEREKKKPFEILIIIGAVEASLYKGISAMNITFKPDDLAQVPHAVSHHLEKLQQDEIDDAAKLIARSIQKNLPLHRRLLWWKQDHSSLIEHSRTELTAIFKQLNLEEISHAIQ